MKLKKHEYMVEVELDKYFGKYVRLKDLCGIRSVFVIKAVPVNEKKAQKIAKILFAKYKKVKVVSIKSL